jgi:hypothetical protein
LFWTQSAAAVSMFLAADLKGLELVQEDGKTLLHYCVEEDIILSESILSEPRLRNQLNVNYKGCAPLFRTRSANAVEMFLAADLDGLELLRDDGKTLLHHCVEEGFFTDTILTALAGQKKIMFKGKIPLLDGSVHII